MNKLEPVLQDGINKLIAREKYDPNTLCFVDNLLAIRVAGGMHSKVGAVIFPLMNQIDVIADLVEAAVMEKDR